MSRGTAMEQTAQRVDRLLRSLVGVDDVRPSCDANGRLRALHILRNAQVTDHQLARNVVSGLQAALGLTLEAGSVRIYADGAVFATAMAVLDSRNAPAPTANGAAAPGTPAAADAAAGLPVPPMPAVPSATAPAGAVPVIGANGNGRSGHGAQGNGTGFGAAGHANGNGAGHGAAGHANGNGAGHGAVGHANGNGRHVPRDRFPGFDAVVDAAGAPAGNGHAAASGNGHGHHGHHGHPAAAQPPRAEAGEPMVAGRFRLDRLSVERHGPMLRCRVALAADGRTYSAIAEVPDTPGAEAELAARVTLDAIRASNVACATLEGVGLTQIANVTYVVAAVRPAGSDTPRACAVRLHESVARAAAGAILGTVACMIHANGAATGIHARGV